MKNRGEVALEIVLDEKNMEEVGIGARAEGVPGKSDNQEGQNCERMEHAEGGAEFSGGNGPQKNAATGENERGRTLGEGRDAQPEAEEKQVDFVVWRAAQRIGGEGVIFFEDGNGGNESERQGGGEEHVRASGAGEGDYTDTRGKNQEGGASGSAAIAPEGESGRGQGGNESRKSGGEARGPLHRRDEFESDSGRPIVEDWFFKPWMGVKSWGEPIAGRRHMLCNPGVARLVGPDEADRCESREETNGQDDAGHERSGEAIRASVMIFCHGAEVYQRCAGRYMRTSPGKTSVPE